MPALDQRTLERFETALAHDQLKELSDIFVREGLPQVAIYDLFESFWKLLGATGRDRDEASLGCALDSIIGWGPRESLWFNHYLSNDEIDAYRRTNPAQ